MEQNKEKQIQSKSKGKKQTRQTREQRRQLEMILVGILILIVIIVIAVLVIHRRTYHNYSVLSSSKNENVQAYGFVQFEDEILKYGTDGGGSRQGCDFSVYFIKRKSGWNGSDIQADFKSKSGENRSCCCNFTG